MASEKRSPYVWLNLVYVLLLAAGAVLIVLGSTGFSARPDLGVLCIGLGAGAAIVTVAAFPIALLALRRSSDTDLEGVERLLGSIHERLLISEAAKRINARKRDCDMLRRAIEADITSGDLDSALMLTTELGSSFGQKQESEEFRDRIIAERATQYHVRVDQAIDRFEALLADQQWESASAEVAKIQRLFPESPRINDLPERITQAWEQHKQDLVRQFLEAAQRDDIDLATSLLQDLDKYLSEGEAAPFVEMARGVFRKKKQNLGVQFKMAVQDRDWIMASQVGEHIIREFPNTRMAGEIRGMVDALRERAANQSAATRNM